MEPARILHIVHALDRGGMENRIMDIYRNLNRSKFQYDFYTELEKPGIFDHEVSSLGGRIYHSNGMHRFNIPDFRSFYRFLKEHPEYRIVYATNQWAGWYLKEAKKCGVPYRVASARTSIQTNSFKNRIKNLVKLNVNKYATHRFAVSKKAAVWLFGEKMVNDGQVNIWPNAIDTEKFAFSEEVRQKVRKELGIRRAFTVIHVGNIRYEKNHKFLLRVFAEVKKRRWDAKLVLIGSGGIEALQPQMKDAGIDNSVIYLGARQDVPKLLQAGDVFVFPSLYEGFPGAVLEAEASGLNCLISNTITEEVLLTDHIRMMSITDEPRAWAESVDEFGPVEREDAWRNIRKAGYDIFDLVKKTEAFFDSIVK